MNIVANTRFISTPAPGCTFRERTKFDGAARRRLFGSAINERFNVFERVRFGGHHNRRLNERGLGLNSGTMLAAVLADAFGRGSSVLAAGAMLSGRGIGSDQSGDTGTAGEVVLQHLHRVELLVVRILKLAFNSSCGADCGGSLLESWASTMVLWERMNCVLASIVDAALFCHAVC